MEAEPGQVPYVRVVLRASAAAVADALTLDIRAHAEARCSRSSASSPDDRRLALGEPREPGRLQLRGLEEALSSWWTRKLSDVTPSMVFPLLPVTALELWCELRGARPPGNSSPRALAARDRRRDGHDQYPRRRGSGLSTRARRGAVAGRGPSAVARRPPAAGAPHGRAHDGPGGPAHPALLSSGSRGGAAPTPTTRASHAMRSPA